MNDKRWRIPQGHPLNARDNGLGVFFGPDGPSIGSVALLKKTDGVLVVRPIEELEYVLGLAFDKGIDFARYIPALSGVARALNAGDEAQAMLRVQLMGLPVLPDTGALERAVEAEELLKASPDDPKHPGYPRGAPDGRGGQFRPKGAALGEEAERVVEKRLRNLVVRRAFRAGLRRIMTPRAALRLLGEAASNIDPLGPAELGDALAIEQFGEMIGEGSEIKAEAEAALDFVRDGPHDLEDLYVSEKPESFDSFGEFKKTSGLDYGDLEKRFGDAKPGYEYHHLAEQGANGRALSPRQLNSTDNIVEIPKLIHEEINSELATNRTLGGVRQSLRASLRGKSFEAHRLQGIELMRQMGIIK